MKTALKERAILAGGQLIFWQLETIFFSIFQRLLPFPPSGNNLSRKQWFPQEERKAVNTVNKRILFPLNKNYDSTSRNEGFVKKNHFHFAKKLLPLAGVTHRKWFPVEGER